MKNQVAKYFAEKKEVKPEKTYTHKKEKNERNLRQNSGSMKKYVQERVENEKFKKKEEK